MESRTYGLSNRQMRDLTDRFEARRVAEARAWAQTRREREQREQAAQVTEARNWAAGDTTHAERATCAATLPCGHPVTSPHVWRGGVVWCLACERLAPLAEQAAQHDR